MIIIMVLGVAYIIVSEAEKCVSVKLIVSHIMIVSTVQVLWSVAYMLYLYLYDKSPSYILYIIAICLTTLVIYKVIGKMVYWLLTNMILSPLISFVWIGIDNSAFDGFMGGVGQWLTPLIVVIINMVGQLGIWSAIKFYNWESQGKVRDKLPLKQSLIKGVKILSFQIALSLALSIILVMNNLIVSYSVIAFSLYLIFIIRKKLGGHYIFWAISWGIIFWEIVKLSFEYVHIIFKVQDADLNEDLVMICLIGFPIYHILLAIYFKLKEDKK